MADFVNEFSWSKSRHDVFADCERKYYYHYYGSWNGWKWNADPRIQKIYHLKKLQSRYMWIGSAVHETLETVLKKYRCGDDVKELDHWREALLQKMRFQYAASREGFTKRPVWRLFEHEYEQDVSKEEWKAMADQAVLGLENFWKSEVHQTIQSLQSDEWLEIEEFSSFRVDGVKIHAVLDFSYRRDGQYYIYDWKTGKSDKAMNELQLACYRMYAQDKWQAAPKDIHAVEYNITLDRCIDHHAEVFPEGEALAAIRQSISNMREKLLDVEKNEAVEDTFDYVADESKCQSCVFKKICRRFE